MKTLQRTTLMLALAGALSMPSVLLAAEAAQDEHESHHPEETQEAATLPVAQAGMQERRRIRDPEKRMQMKDGDNCLMAGQKGGGMMGQGMGMMRGGMMMGQGMQGMSGQDGMLAKRMEMLEKRMDLMQMMMQMQMQMGGPRSAPEDASE